MLVQGKLKPARKLPREEEYQLVAEWVEKSSEKALLELVRAESKNIYHIARIAHKNNSTIPEEDFQQVATIAFIECLDDFDPKRGNRIATYTSWWMKSAISAYTTTDAVIRKSPMNTNWAIKLATRQELARHNEYNIPLGEVFTAVSEKLNVPRESVEYYYLQSLPVRSLDAPLSPGSDSDDSFTLLDRTINDDDIPQEEYSNQGQIVSLIREGLNKLPAREQYVLRKRFGIASEDESLLQHIGDDLGISRERARQIESRGLKMLQAVLMEKGFSADTMRDALSP